MRRSVQTSKRASGATILFALAVLGIALLVACAPPVEEEQAPADGGEDWVWLQETKQELDAKREELGQLRDRIAGKVPEEAEAVAAAGEEAEAAEEGTEEAVPLTPEELAANAETLENEVNALTGEFGERLVAFINAQDMNMGEEMNEIQRGALDMRIDEDIIVAQEYIDKGGNYQKAIDIYRSSLVFDPENEKLKAAMAWAEANRFMTEERFAQVKKRMSQDQVREFLGQVKHGNEREFENNVVGWFYKKEDGGATGVYFRQRRGEWEVYEADFNAIKPTVIEGESEEESAE